MTRFIVPQEHMQTVETWLREAGRSGREGKAVWATSEPRGSAEVEVCETIIPAQVATSVWEGCTVTVPLDYREALTRRLYREGKRLVAQIHSHPGEAFHSPTDNRHPMIHHQGAISIVVPDFCMRGFEMETAAVYELVNLPRWRRLPPEEVQQRFEVVP